VITNKTSVLSFMLHSK